MMANAFGDMHMQYGSSSCVPLKYDSRNVQSRAAILAGQNPNWRALAVCSRTRTLSGRRYM